MRLGTWVHIKVHSYHAPPLGGGGHWARVLDADPPPPSWKLGGKCRTIGAKGAVSNFCLTWQRVKACCHSTSIFHLEFLGEFKGGQKLALFSEPKISIPSLSTRC